VVGPHFEELCREFATVSGHTLFGETGQVTSGVVADPANRRQIQVDVVVLVPGTRKVLSLGEVKWGKTMRIRHLDRLRRARDLLTAKGFDTGDAVLVCYSGAGFDADLRTAAASGGAVALVGLADLYAC
jgi:hypothetical protein